jgi:hypothetical protein
MHILLKLKYGNKLFDVTNTHKKEVNITVITKYRSVGQVTVNSAESWECSTIYACVLK